MPSDESVTPAHVYVYISLSSSQYAISFVHDMVFHSVLLTLILSITYAAVQESGIERRPVLMRCVDPDCSGL